MEDLTQEGDFIASQQAVAEQNVIYAEGQQRVAEEVARQIAAGLANETPADETPTDETPTDETPTDETPTV